jgi:uncharacterized membrane protein YadS
MLWKIILWIVFCLAAFNLVASKGGKESDHLWATIIAVALGTLFGLLVHQQNKRKSSKHSL